MHDKWNHVCFQNERIWFYPFLFLFAQAFWLNYYIWNGGYTLNSPRQPPLSKDKTCKTRIKAFYGRNCVFHEIIYSGRSK